MERKDMPEQPPCTDNTPQSEQRLSDPATFECLYESRDGKLLLFETKEGHLAAVDSSKLI